MYCSYTCSYQEIRVPVAPLTGQPIREIAALSPVNKPSKRVNLTKRCVNRIQSDSLLSYLFPLFYYMILYNIIFILLLYDSYEIDLITTTAYYY